jgi:hypothetical protein
MTENKRYININSDKKSKKATLAKQLGGRKSKYHNKYYFRNTNDEIEKLFKKYGEIKKIYLEYIPFFSKSRNYDYNNGLFYNKRLEKPYIFNDKTKLYVDMMQILQSKDNFINGYKTFHFSDDEINNKIRKNRVILYHEDQIKEINMFKRNNIFSPKLLKNNIKIINNTISKYEIEHEYEHEYEFNRYETNSSCIVDRLKYYIIETIQNKNIVLEDILLNHQKRHFKKEVNKELIEKVWHPKRFNFWKNYDDMFIELEEQ